MLEVVTIETPGLGDRSYLAHDGEVALVVDPQRDVDRVVAAAQDAGVKITHVAETHVHNDYVTGGVELAASTGAAYLVAAGEDVAYDRLPVDDGNEIEIGSFTVRVLHTPGHTLHHVSYLVLETGEPVALFTGGSLLYGTVGRTDLIATGETEGLTRAQFRSAHRLASELPDSVAVWPTHGFGSFCSSAASSGAAHSSIGDEKVANLALTAGNEDAFVKQLLSGLTAYPTYYAHMSSINRAGPRPLDLTPPAMVDPEELGKRIRAGAWVVDLGRRRAFAAGHLAGTTSFELGNPFATYFGWLVPWGTPITFVADSPEQVADAQRALVRIGFDEIAGAATGPREVLAAGAPLASYAVADFGDLARALGKGEPLIVLDVRRDDERATGAIAGSVHVPLQELLDRLGELPDGTLWVHCASGFRASIASSLLHRAGREVVYVDDEWARAEALGMPMSHSTRRAEDGGTQMSALPLEPAAQP